MTKSYVSVVNSLADSYMVDNTGTGDDSNEQQSITSCESRLNEVIAQDSQYS